VERRSQPRDASGSSDHSKLSNVEPELVRGWFGILAHCRASRSNEASESSEAEEGTGEGQVPVGSKSPRVQGKHAHGRGKSALYIYVYLRFKFVFMQKLFLLQLGFLLAL